MKKFLIIASINSFNYNSTFEYIRTGKIWAGTKYDVNGMLFIKCNSEDTKKVLAKYMTNLNYDFTKPNLNLTKHYNPVDYPKYDNYDAIEVSRCPNIPIDYTGMMGVPITFIQVTNYQQFEIVGKISPILNGKPIYSRLIIRRKV